MKLNVLTALLASAGAYEMPVQCEETMRIKLTTVDAARSHLDVKEALKTDQVT